MSYFFVFPIICSWVKHCCHICEQTQTSCCMFCILKLFKLRFKVFTKISTALSFPQVLTKVSKRNMMADKWANFDSDYMKKKRFWRLESFPNACKHSQCQHSSPFVLGHCSPASPGNTKSITGSCFGTSHGGVCFYFLFNFLSCRNFKHVLLNILCCKANCLSHALL